MTEQELIKKIDKLRNQAIGKYGVGTRNKQQELDNDISFLDGQIKGIQDRKKEILQIIDERIAFIKSEENCRYTTIVTRNIQIKELEQFKQKIEEKIC